MALERMGLGLLKGTKYTQMLSVQWQGVTHVEWLVRAQGRLQNKPSYSLFSAGKGLGRKENGITQAIKVTLKQDTHGVRLQAGQHG